MKLFDSLNRRLTGKLPRLVFLLLLLQPLMDVLSFWVAKWGLSNLPTLALRFLLLGLTLLLGFSVSQKKKVYYIAGGVCIALGVGHMVSCFISGYRNIFTDLSNYVRVLQLPITTLCMISFLKQDDACYDAMKKGIAANLGIILLVQILAIVTGTEPHTYDDGAGYIGWFATTNTQSAILTMAVPVAATWLYEKKGVKSPFLWIALLGGGASMFYIGTRLCYAGFVLTCFGLGFSILLTNFKRAWTHAVLFVLLGVLFVAIMPYAPMSGHRGSHSEEMALKQNWIQQQIQQGKDEEAEKPAKPGEPDPGPLFPVEELNLTPAQIAYMDVIGPVYKHYVSDMVSVLGLERTIILYNYTTDIVTLTNLRQQKLLFAKELMAHSPVTSMIFGLELDRFTEKGVIFDVENDFHGIYYLYGIVGLILMLAFVAYFLFLIARALLKNFKRYFTVETVSWGVALILCLAHCYCTAAVLRRPNASFYMAVVLAAVYYLTQLKKYPQKTEV